MKHSIIIALTLYGCGLFGGDTTPAKLRTEANDYRVRLNAAHDRVRSGYDFASLICETVRSDTLQVPCAALDRAVSGLDLAYTSARDGLDLYESGLAVAEAVEMLVSKYERAGDGVQALSEKVEAYAKVVADIARSCSESDPATSGQPGVAAEGSGTTADAGSEAASPANAERPAGDADGPRRDPTRQPESAAPRSGQAAEARP